MKSERTSSNNSGHLHIAYVGPIDFPSSSAPAQRMMGIIQALNVVGDRVSVGSGGYQTSAHVPIHDLHLNVTALGELPNPKWLKPRRIIRGLTWGKATRDWVLKMDPAPDLILVYGTALGYLAWLIPLARSRRIPLVIDATEWYESSHLPGGKFGPISLANSLSMHWLALKADGVLAISSFLENYFEGKGVPALRVPPLFAVEDISLSAKMQQEPLALCYVGSPGRKDRDTIRNLVRLPGALGLERNSKKLRIHIVGIDAVDARALLGEQAGVDIRHECLVFHGRLPSPRARRVILDSHFSVLQRSPKRYAQAGYPSKVPESLLLGTPVMANLTSDLANVLVDGTNSVILGDASFDSLLAKVSLAIASSYDFDKEAIAAEARASFSPGNYAEELHTFLAELRESL